MNTLFNWYFGVSCVGVSDKENGYKARCDGKAKVWGYDEMNKIDE